MLANALKPALMTNLNQVSGDARKSDSSSDKQQTQRSFANVYLMLSAAPSGLLLGWLIDSAAGTKPWFTLGCCTAFLLVAVIQLLKDLR